MDLRRLQMLARVIEMGSFTRASANLGISQPALSQHIQTLEHSAGATLLHRTRDGVIPTEAGMVAYRNAKLLARQLEIARTEVRTLASTPSGRVTIGIAPHSRGGVIVLPLLRAALQKFPEVLLHVVENFEGSLSEDLRKGRMDLAILYEGGPLVGYHCRRLTTEVLKIVAKPGMVDPHHEKPFAIPLILPAYPHAVRKVVEAVYDNSGTQLVTLSEIESFETLQEAVSVGIGATILPQSAASALARMADLEVHPFGDTPTVLNLVLVSREDSTLSPAARAILGFIPQLARECGLTPQDFK